MTAKEKEQFEALTKQLAQKDEQIDALKANCESAYEEVRVRNQQLDQLIRKFNEDMDYVKKLTAGFAESIIRVSKGDQTNGNQF